MAKFDTTKAAQGPHIGGLRIAKISYEHVPLYAGGTGSIGEAIDEHIRQTLSGGNLVSEVSVFFETREQQEALAAAYVGVR